MAYVRDLRLFDGIVILIFAGVVGYFASRSNSPDVSSMLTQSPELEAVSLEAASDVKEGGEAFPTEEAQVIDELLEMGEEPPVDAGEWE